MRRPARDSRQATLRLLVLRWQQDVQAPLSGMGTDFTASLSGASSQTVASGQTASYALVLTPMSGSPGTFTFACGFVACERSVQFQPFRRNGGCEFERQRNSAGGDWQLGVVCARFATGGLGRGSSGMRIVTGAAGVVAAAKVFTFGSTGIVGDGRAFQLFRLGRGHGRRAAGRSWQYEYTCRDVFHSSDRRVERGIAFSDIVVDRGLDTRRSKPPTAIL